MRSRTQLMRFRKSRNTRESGIALLLAIFALLLLSAVSLSMIYAANIETGVGANFRDKEIASYAAASGMQVARDLVRPGAYLDPDQAGAQGGILLPAGVLQGLPSLGAKNVLYIVNPAPGETVEPWVAGSKYADPELCHDNVLGLTGTTGTPCTGTGALPTGNWWHAVNASDTPFASYL